MVAQNLLQLPLEGSPHLRVLRVHDHDGQDVDAQVDGEVERVRPQVVRVRVDRLGRDRVQLDGRQRGADEHGDADEVGGEVDNRVLGYLVVSHLLLLAQDFVAAFEYF